MGTETEVSGLFS